MSVIETTVIEDAPVASLADTLLRDRRIPLLIGVVGHRDIDPVALPGIRENVKNVLGELKLHYPKTQLVLLSALAEGADRLVVEEGLKLDIPFVAALPLPIDAYVEDFTEASSREEFSRLLAQAVTNFDVGPTSPSNPIPSGPSPQRDQCYAALGAYLVRQSQIMIALWDGKDNGKIGGTAHVVRQQLQGVDPPENEMASLLEPVEFGPVIHIATPRQSSSDPKSKQISVERLYHPGFRDRDAAAKYYNRLFSRLDDYNEQLVRHLPALADNIAESRRYLIPDPVFETLDTLDMHLAETYAAADAMAMHYSNRTTQSLNFLTGLGFLATFFFILFAHVIPHPGTAATYLMLVVMGAFVYRKAEGKDVKRRYLDYRALAEGFRVQFFWRLSDIDAQAADHYLYKHRSELDWIRNALRAATTITEKDEHSRRLSLVTSRWVEPQAEYFLNRSERFHGIHQQHRKTVRGLLIVAVAITFVLLVVSTIKSVSTSGSVKHYMTELGDMHRVVDDVGGHLPFGLAIGFAGLLFATAAFIEWYDERRAYCEIGKQYRRMSDTYQLALSRVTQEVDRHSPARATQALLHLGKESLAENGDWVLLHRERPMEQPFA